MLLDTHLLLWALAAPDKLASETKTIIRKSEVFVSAASIWEIAIKSAIGKLDAHPEQILAGVVTAGFDFLAISAEHAANVANLPVIHKDPFDRILISQALCEPMILLTNDTVLKPYGSLIMLIL